MTDLPDDLPDDVYAFVERMAATSTQAAALLRKYPRSQPEPAWQPGDAAIFDRRVWVRDDETPTWKTYDGACSERAVPADADRIARAGRRVHPPRFADHAVWLRALAEDLRYIGPPDQDVDPLYRIATDLAGDG